jgi:hypothetical protein
MTNKWIIGLSILIIIIYTIFVPFASNGYGYMGYYGYYSNPSLFYWNDTHYYHNKDLKQGSRTGPSVRGGGPGRGK